jgi:outer membrane protein
MVVSSRAIVAVGLGFGVLAGAAFGQGSAPAKDGAVGKATGQAQPQAPAARPAVPAVFGTVDLETAIKNYDKYKSQMSEFEAAAKAKQGELAKIHAEAQDEIQKLQKMTPNSVDAKRHEDRITQLKATFEAQREQAERDFSMRQAEMLSTIYKEVQDMVRRVAQFKGMTYVVQVSNEPVTSADPRTVMAAMAKTVVYADPRNDITQDVVHNLNRMYKAAGGTAPRTAAPAAGGNPAGN